MVLALQAIGSTSTARMPSQLAASRDVHGWLSKWSLRRAAAICERSNRESAPMERSVWSTQMHADGERGRVCANAFHSPVRNRTAQLPSAAARITSAACEPQVFPTKKSTSKKAQPVVHFRH